MRHPSFLPGILLSLCLTACKGPEGSAGPPAWVLEAGRQAKQASLRVDPQGQAAFREGFLNGTEMVRKSRESGMRPFLPRQGAPFAAVPRTSPPPGVEILVPPPSLEVDPETGLQLAPAMGGSETFAQGQVEGFRWAWAQVGGTASPPPPPELPSQWIPWPPSSASLRLPGPALDGRILWLNDVLLWTAQTQGFPSRQRWRVFPWGRPRAAALGRDALWVALPDAALALDLDSGAIRKVAPSPGPMAAGEEDPGARERAWLKAQREDPAILAAREALRQRAAAGDPLAMFKLAMDLRDLDPASGQESLVWLRKAAAANHGEALMELGALHYYGRRVPEDKVEARRCFERAQAAGRPEARELLDLLFPRLP
ncbi:MAG: sel1 repeat family protein [Acidobacteria bacterium]|nr:sel1 repeat family protein [Acidobacteriota bacterium]